MSAVLRAGLAIGGYRACVVVRDHYDQAWSDYHQERQEIAHPFGFHHASAHRHHFVFHAGRGHAQCLVRHRLPSFLLYVPQKRTPLTRVRASADARRHPAHRQNRNAKYRGELPSQLVLREKETAASTPAFTTESSVWKKRGRGDRGGYRYRITTVSSTICPSVLGGRSSLGSIYLSGGERSLREMKKPSPPAQRNGQLSQNDR